MQTIIKSIKKPSIYFLVAANSIPIIGALLFNWDVFSIMVLYWFESAIVGLYTIGKMVAVGIAQKEIAFKKPNDPSGDKTVRGIAVPFAILFMVVFFCFHFGAFMYGHLTFIFAIFGPEGPLNVSGELVSWQLVYRALQGAWIAILALFVSHGFSFVRNFLGNKEYEHINPSLVMFAPYKRIILMHVTLIFGGILVMVLKLPVAGLILMIILKVLFDTNAHIKEHIFKKMEHQFVQMPSMPKKQPPHAPVVIFLVIIIFAVVIIFSIINKDDNQESISNTSINNTIHTNIQLSSEDTIAFDKDNHLLMTDLFWDEGEGRFLMTTDGSMMELFVDNNNQIDWSRSFASMTGDYVLRGWTGPYIVNKATMQIDMNQGGAWPLAKEQKDPSALTQQGQYLWVADSAMNKLYKYDRKNKYLLVGSYKAGGTSVVGVAWDGDNIWSADSDILFRYNYDMTINSNFRLPVMISGITVRNGVLWATALSESKLYNLSTYIE